MDIANTPCLARVPQRTHNVIQFPASGTGRHHAASAKPAYQSPISDDNSAINGIKFGNRGGLRVLLIEDNPVDAQLFEQQLRENSTGPLRCERMAHWPTADDAQRWGNFDVVFLDLDLPNSGCWETLQRLHQTAPPIAIVVLTGTDDEALITAALAAGAQDYLVKGDYQSDLLERTARHAIERHRLLGELKRSQDREWRLVNLDPVTGLPNRHLFEQIAHSLMAYERQASGALGLLMLGLDRFKPINDALGFAVGDELLRVVAERLEQVVGPDDIVSRLGGGEFAVLLNGLREPNDANQAAEIIIDSLSTPMLVGDRELVIGVSIGMALTPTDAVTVDELIRLADLAMERVKRLGGNRCQRCGDGLDASARERLSLETDLRRALALNQLSVFYQPTVDLDSGAIESMEALIRWRHPRRGMVPPDRFISVAEENDLILEIDAWVLQQACRQAVSWQQQGHQVRVAVNLSARHFGRTDLVVLIKKILLETGLAPCWLEIEVTETGLLQHPELAASVLSTLRGLGVYIAIDDFGMGYSSLNYLKHLPADALKIDRSFLDGVPEDGQNAALTTAIINLAGTLNLAVVGEGIETAAQLDWLRTTSCQRAQGYFFARPQPEPSFHAVPLASH